MSATRDEVLRAMARALCSGYGLCPTCESAGQCVGDMNEGAFLDEAKRALAAAEQAGWVLVPVEPAEEMVRAAYEVGRRWLTDRGKPRAAWGDLGSDERWFMRQCARAILACEPTAKP